MDRDDILQAAAKGNASALEFLRVFARRAHWIDDVADLDLVGDVSEQLAMHESEWLLTLASNQFFLTHRAQLVPAMILAINAWADSACLPAAQRDVVKGQWHEVVWLVAFLVGGTLHLRDMTGQFRAYDVEPEENSQNSETQKPEMNRATGKALNGLSK